MKKIVKGILIGALAISTIGIATSCSMSSKIASHNLSKDADDFKIYRRVVFYNGITDKYILEVDGYSSIYVDKEDGQLELIVKTEDGKFIKHFLGLSDNVTYFAEQLNPENVSSNRYKVVFKPSEIVPDIAFSE